MRIGYYPQGASESQKSAMWTALQRASTDNAAMVLRDPGLDYDPIQYVFPKTGEATKSFNELAKFANDEIAKLVLGQKLTSDADGKGSYKLGEIHDSIRRTILAADCDALCTTIRRDLIYPLVLFNFGEAEAQRLPWFEIYHKSPGDLKAKAETHGILARELGMTLSERQIREEYGLDPVEDESDAVSFSPTGTPASAPPAPPVEDQAHAMASDDARPVAAPSTTVGAMMSMPAPVKQAATEYAAVVDGFNEMAFRNTMDNVTKYLAHRDHPWSSGDAFAKEFSEWWEKKWWTFYGNEGISQGSLYPFLNRMYGYYKTVDKTPGLSGAFSMTDIDSRAVDFMARSDRWYFSKFIDNDSFRGPLQRFLLDEYEERGGMLWGKTNEKVIKGFRKAVTKTAHNLSRYEVDRIIKSTVNRNRVWAHVSQMHDGGIEYAEIVNGGDPCQYCAAVDGAKIQVASTLGWIETAMAMDDDGFRKMLDDRTNAHRAGVKAGMDKDMIASGTVPPFHPNCACRLVSVIP